MIAIAPPAQPKDVEFTEVREVIFEIMGIYWSSVTVTEMIQKLKERGVGVDKEQ